MRSLTKRELLLIALFMGFSASICQVLLIREILTLCRGNELIIGVILSSWFLGIYIGARVKQASGTRVLKLRVFLSLFLLPLLTATSVYSANLLQVFFPRAVGTFYSFSAELLLALVFTIPIGFFVGLFFPALVALISIESGEKSGGMVFYVESFGSFAGGMVFAFVLVEHANPLAIASILMFFGLVIIFFRERRWFLVISAVPLIFLIFSVRIEQKILSYVWEKTHTGALIEYRRTRYETVAVESSGVSVSVYGDGMLMHTIPDGYEARGIFHLVQSLRDNRRKILIMGSGPGALVHNLLMADIDRLYYFEPDPELWSMLQPYARRYYRWTDKGKLSAPREDLRRFLRKSGDSFDMIICIPPQPENLMLNRFYTREFYSLCKNSLSDQGIVIAALHGFSDYMSNDLRDYIASMYSAFIAEFPTHLKTSGETVYLIGAKNKGVLPESVEALVHRYGSAKSWDRRRFDREIVNNFSPDELKMFFERSQLEYFDRIVMPRKAAVVENRDMKPGVYWKNIVFTAFKEKSAMHGVVRGLWLIPVVVFILSCMALWDIRRRCGPSAMLYGLIMYITGFVSISTMIVMILMYQNMQGIIYHRIALINALFMLGLYLGGFIFNRKKILKLPYVFATIAFSLILILVLPVQEAGFLYWMLLVLFSFASGAVFPALFISDRRTDYYSRASVLDSMDHIGALTGSLLSVALLLPLIGIQGAIIVNIVLVSVACLMSLVRKSM